MDYQIEPGNCCPVCGSRIEINSLDVRAGWAAECSCCYIEHPHMTGITLRLKAAAMKKAHERRLSHEKP